MNYHRQADNIVTPPREPHTYVDWLDAFYLLTNRSNRPVNRDTLRIHLEHRRFAPYDPEAVDSRIDGAISSGVIDEKGDGSLEYNGEFVTIPFDVGGEARIDVKPR